MEFDHSTRCDGCDSEQTILIHYIKDGNSFRLLCTSCLLKLRVGSFCPNCFELYEGSPPKDGLKCLKCPSILHSACADSNSGSHYVCNSCLNPKSPFLRINNNKSSGDDGETVVKDVKKQFDLIMAKAFVAATRFSSLSMNRALVSAKYEMDKKARDAVITRKRAREAIEKVFVVVSEEKEKRARETLERSFSSLSEEKGFINEHGRISSSGLKSEDRTTKGNSAVSAALAAQRRIQEIVKRGGKDKPVSSITSSDSGSREWEKWLGFTSQTTVQNQMNDEDKVVQKNELKPSDIPSSLDEEIVENISSCEKLGKTEECQKNMRFSTSLSEKTHDDGNNHDLDANKENSIKSSQDSESKQQILTEQDA